MGTIASRCEVSSKMKRSLTARGLQPLKRASSQVFGEILSLIPLADNVIKLSALCMVCKDGTEGPFSKRLTSDTCQECVGGASEYAAVCRKHLYG